MIASGVSHRARHAAARATLVRGDRVLLAMRGTSMLPLLRAPMVLEVVPLRRRARIGEILVFDQRDHYVVHRVVRYQGDAYVTSGDAQPHVVEVVPPQNVLGRVAAIRRDDGEGAPRVDGILMRVRGWSLARLHVLRAAIRRNRWYLQAARPRKREPAVTALFHALRGTLRNDAGALLGAARTVSAAALTDAAKRHRCGPLLAAAIERYELERHPYFSLVHRELSQSVWGTALAASHARAQLSSLTRLVSLSGIDAVLLKGAARLLCDDQEAERHVSSDIDILVASDDQAMAVNALLLAGYRQKHDRTSVARYLREHHHAAPLSKPGCHPVEVHVQLAPPGRFSSRTTLEDLRSHLVPVGPHLFRLDPVASVFHLALHMVGSMSLRDAYLMAIDVRAMDEGQRSALASMARRECRDGVRLGGVLCLAAGMAGISWPATAAERRYARWMLQCADMPRTLRKRSHLIEAVYASRSGGLRAAWRVLAHRATFGQVMGRVAAGICAGLFAASMRRA